MDEILAWTYALWQRRAERVVPTPGGCAVLTPSFSAAHDHNKLMVQKTCDAGDLAAAADQHLDRHRLIEVGSASVADQLEPGLASQGYTRDGDLVMLFAGEGKRTDTEVLGFHERVRVASEEWKRDEPDWDPDVWRQLGERAVTATRACTTTFLGIRREGQVVARADLFVHGGIAQVEEVMTDPAYRGRGFASALVLDAVARAGVEKVFIVADLDDWPKELYRKLGFQDLGVTTSFRR